MPTTVSMTKQNFMQISDFNNLENYDNHQIYNIDIDTDTDLHKKIVQWGMPDEDNAIAIASGYLIPATGYIKVVASSAACTITINGYNAIVYAASYNNTNIFTYPVKANDLFIVASGSATSYSFVPCLGNLPTPDPTS